MISLRGLQMSEFGMPLGEGKQLGIRGKRLASDFVTIKDPTPKSVAAKWQGATEPWPR